MRNFVVFAFVAIVTLSGCASNMGGNTYSQAQVRGMQKVVLGVVDSIRPVTIEAVSKVGASAGVGAGALAGSNIGSGRGALFGILAGAVIGGIVGHVADKAVNSKDGLEITVKLDDGDLVAVTQSIEGSDAIASGDRVRVVVDQIGVSRVQRL